ncbi:uncharacterized protein LOC131967759 isoform X2 [Centropristis striata]|uniref:uncharacterized protein LOC131967759 isoform X2 n=1 Tax=Centropristis striata TaxID=184440 RepID=UPI0027E147AC|nr:uncharacterized protein LOC131967759 isoform X2 [Centropristis striata]
MTLTCMRVKEVKEALGDDGIGYLINVRDHKTLRKFGLAQLYLDGEEYGWCKRWLDLRRRCVATNPYFFSFGKGQAKDMVRYVRRAWAEMGLPGSPSLLDVRSAVATYNFESNKEDREKVASFMCHSVATQESFYALHKTVALAGLMRQLFVMSSLEEKELAAPLPSPPPVSPRKSSDSSLTITARRIRKRFLSPAKKTPEKKLRSTSSAPHLAGSILFFYMLMNLAWIAEVVDQRSIWSEIANCGYTSQIKLVSKESIIRAIVLHSTTSVIPMLQQLRQGMELYGLVDQMALFVLLILIS